MVAGAAVGAVAGAVAGAVTGAAVVVVVVVAGCASAAFERPCTTTFRRGKL